MVTRTNLSSTFRTGAARLALLTLTLASAAALVQPAWAHEPGMGGARHGGMHGGGHGGPGLFGGPGLGRMLDSVKATPEQRSQIEALVKAAQPEMQAARESGRKLREQHMALMAQPTVDARALETLRQQQMAQHDAASKRMTQLMLEVSRVLTPEQRQQLAQRMQRRAEMMQRHRAEREQLDGGTRR
jgi:periplasmic protein CpxP/Spy